MNEPTQRPPRRTYAQREAAQADHRARFPLPPVSRPRRPKQALPDDADDAAMMEGRTPLDAARLRLILAALRAAAPSPLNTTVLCKAMGLQTAQTTTGRGHLMRWAGEGVIHVVSQGRGASRNGGNTWGLGKVPACSSPS